MPTISVNNETEEMVEEIQERLLISPTKKKTVEKAVKQLHEKIMNGDSVEVEEQDIEQTADKEQ